MKNIDFKKIGSILYMSGSILFASALFFSSAIIYVDAAKLQDPTIAIYPDIYYPLDEVLYIEGRALPQQTIELRLQKQGAKPLVYRTRSDSRGEWVFAEKARVEEGDWEVRARVVDVDNPEIFSEWSNPRIFKTVINGITIGSVSIKFSVLSLIIFILMFLGLVLFLYFSHRIRQLKATLISREINEAQKSVRQGFVELRKNVIEELQRLESNKTLSQEELIRKEKLLLNLENMESVTQKEISDIEKEVG